MGRYKTAPAKGVTGMPVDYEPRKNNTATGQVTPCDCFLTKLTILHIFVADLENKSTRHLNGEASIVRKGHGMYMAISSAQIDQPRPVPFTPRLAVDTWNERFRDLQPQALLRWAAERWG